MKEGLFLALVVAFSILIGAVANELGCNAAALSGDIGTPPSPGGFSFFDTFGYIFSAVATYFEIITYQNPCVNAFVSTLMSAVLGLTSLWVILRLIRGGG